jgi:tripartite-type tricarboxylate transporter receptor subunit TctC
VVSRAIAFACFTIALSAMHPAAAQSYPDKPIRVVVASAPGGGTDFVARVLSTRLAENLAQSLVIDNRGGAGGTIGTDIVAKAAADGYTLLVVFVNFAIHPSLYRKLPFDSVRDFSPVSTLATTPLLLVVNPQLPAKSVKDFIALGKAPGSRLNYAAPGVGSLGHLAGELFKSMTGVSMAHIAYKGGGPAITALVGGEVQAYFSTMPAALAQVRAGRLRALAVSSARRAATQPDIPTIAESGVPGYDVTGWFGVLAPARTPASVVKRLNEEFARALATPEVRKRLAGEGLDPASSTPDAFAATIRSDIAKWNKVVTQAGIKAE